MKLFFDTISGKDSDIASYLVSESKNRFLAKERERFERLSKKDKEDPKNSIKQGMFNDFYYWGVGDGVIFCIDGSQEEIDVKCEQLKSFGEIEFRTTPYGDV